MILPMRTALSSRSRWHGRMLWLTGLLALAWIWRLPDSGLSTVQDHDDGGVADALTVSGLDHDLKTGYSLRQDTWGGDLPVGTAKSIQHQVFKENEYRFCAWTSTKGAKISLHVCDHDGNVVESRAWQKTFKSMSVAGAALRPKATGSVYLTVKIDESPEERTPWGMVYAYK